MTGIETLNYAVTILGCITFMAIAHFHSRISNLERKRK